MSKRGPKPKLLLFDPGPNDGGLRRRDRGKIPQRDRGPKDKPKWVYYTTCPDGKFKEFGSDLKSAIRSFESWRDSRLGHEPVALALQVPSHAIFLQKLKKTIESDPLGPMGMLVATDEEGHMQDLGTDKPPRHVPDLLRALTDKFDQEDQLPEHLRPHFLGTRQFDESYSEFLAQHGLEDDGQSASPLFYPKYWAGHFDWRMERYLKDPNSDAEDRLHWPGLRDAALAGKFPRPSTSMSLKEIARKFEDQYQAAKGGQVTSMRNSLRAFKRFADSVGKGRKGRKGAKTARQVTRDHIEDYWNELTGKYAPDTLSKYSGHVKHVLKFVRKKLVGEHRDQVKDLLEHLEDLLDVPRQSGFSKTNGNGQQGPQMVSEKHYEALLKAADPQQCAMLLIGLNCAYYPIDLCRLPVSALDLKSRRLFLPREKTGGTPRVAVLWPRTVEAIREYQAAHKHEAKDPRTGDHLLFANRKGRPLLTCKGEKLSVLFYTQILGPLRSKAGVPKSVEFSHLRDSASTLAKDAVDKDTSKILCGQSIGISDHYIVKTAITKVGKACRAIEQHYFGKPKRKTAKRA